MEFIVIALIILYGFREFLLFKERKEVMDRLMSKNLPEFKDNAKPEDNELEEKEESETLEDAKEEIISGEEE